MKTVETDIKEIRSMMERSSRFLSLSGLSGVFAGIYALLGVWIAKEYYDAYSRSEPIAAISGSLGLHPLLLLALVVLVLSLGTAAYLTSRNAIRKNRRVWDKASRLMLVNFSVPLVAGGLFLIFLLMQGNYYLLAPGMLLFYGLALLNGSKYTLHEIRYLGYCEIALGLNATWFHHYGLLFWALGFGVLHILYGGLMYWKYER